MRNISLAIFLLISFVARADDELIKDIQKKIEIENAVFSYDEISLNRSTSEVLKSLGSCKKIDSDNWNYQCAGEKTYLESTSPY